MATDRTENDHPENQCSGDRLNSAVTWKHGTMHTGCYLRRLNGLAITYSSLHCFLILTTIGRPGSPGVSSCQEEPCSTSPPSASSSPPRSSWRSCPAPACFTSSPAPCAEAAVKGCSPPSAPPSPGCSTPSPQPSASPPCSPPAPLCSPWSNGRVSSTSSTSACAPSSSGAKRKTCPSDPSRVALSGRACSPRR